VGLQFVPILIVTQVKVVTYQKLKQLIVTVTAYGPHFIVFIK
jgi:hypothetical protein